MGQRASLVRARSQKWTLLEPEFFIACNCFSV